MHTANALPYDALTFVADLVTQPPALQPFQRLKERLLLTHQLTTVQMAEKILDMPELGALAVKAGKGKFGGGKKRPDGDSHHPGSGGGGKSGGGKSGSGSGKSYFVCDRHWWYEAKAYHCDAPQKPSSL